MTVYRRLMRYQLLVRFLHRIVSVFMNFLDLRLLPGMYVVVEIVIVSVAVLSVVFLYNLTGEREDKPEKKEMKEKKR